MTAYRTAAERDPRRRGFGYLAGDPATGAPGAFLWFATVDELLAFMCTVEVDLLRFDSGESGRIAASLTRAIRRAGSLARIDRDELSAAFEGWCEILWIGTFADLCTRGGALATEVRAGFRAESDLDEHAGPIADEEMDLFVAHLTRMYLWRDTGGSTGAGGDDHTDGGESGNGA